MPEHHEGGCLCGAQRYALSSLPQRVTYCTCHFCQKMTGTPMNALCVLQQDAFALTSGAPRSYTHVSEGSGKPLHLKSCPTCATTTHVHLERFPGIVGVMLGTLDNPDCFERSPETARYIFADCAQAGTVLPAGFAVFAGPAIDADGAPQVSVVHDTHWKVT